MQDDLAHLVGQGADRAVHVGRVEGVRGVQAAAAGPLAGEPLFQGVHGLRGAGDHGERAGVDGGHRQTVAEAGGGLLLGEEDAEHGAPRHLLDQAAACGDEVRGVLQREHPGQAGGHVLPDAVADHGARPDTPGLPEPGEGVFDAEQRGLGETGLPQPLGRLRVVAAEDQGVGVLAQVRGEELGAPVELGPEDGLAGVQVTGHARVLGALSREEERDRGGVGRGRPGASPARPRSASTASPVVRATTVARCGKVARRRARVSATAPREAPGPASRWSARRAAASASAGADFAESGSRRAGAWVVVPVPRSLPSRGSGSGAGASSRTMCTLVPPMPKELTPARRGASARGQGRSSELT